MKNNKSLIFVILLFPFLVSCKKADNAIATNKSVDSLVIDEKTHIKDSLFIGEPLLKESEFIRNIEDGGNDFYYVKQFENLLKKYNKKYANYKSNEVIKTLKVSDLLTLELKRKKYNLKERSKDIQVLLYTKIKNVTVDSIVFYKYLINSNDTDSRRETMAYLDDNMNLWHLESYSGQSEYFVQPESWIKYNINVTNGKINKVEKLDYKKASNTAIETKEDNEHSNIINATENEKFPFEDSTVKWKLICDNSNPQKNIYFDNHEANFVFSYSDGFRISLIVKKVSGKKYELYYNYPPFFPAPKDMDYENYSTTEPSAVIKVVNDTKIEFIWLGFHNNKTNKRERLKNPFTQKVESSPIILERCSQ